MKKKYYIKEGRSWHRGLLTPYVERVRLERIARNIRPDDTVLDVGCGTGGLLELLPPTVGYVGVDVFETSLNLARQRFDRGQFIQVDLTRETPHLGRFSVIVMAALIEHIPDPEMLIEKLVNNYLEEGGRIVLTTPAPWGRIVHEVGATIGLFSRDAAQEHGTFWERSDLARLSSNLRLHMTLFQRFLFGFNQLACLEAFSEDTGV